LLTNWKYRPGLGEEANPVTGEPDERSDIVFCSC
jgi:hypothetical protein